MFNKALSLGCLVCFFLTITFQAHASDDQSKDYEICYGAHNGDSISVTNWALAKRFRDYKREEIPFSYDSPHIFIAFVDHAKKEVYLRVIQSFYFDPIYELSRKSPDAMQCEFIPQFPDK